MSIGHTLVILHTIMLKMSVNGQLYLSCQKYRAFRNMNIIKLPQMNIVIQNGLILSNHNLLLHSVKHW